METNNNQQFEQFSRCKAIVCDLDGTLYLDNIPFAASFPFLEKIIRSGRKLFYFTNNSSRSRATYLQKLAKIGFPVKDDYMITSTDCAESYLRRHSLCPDIYLVGNSDLKHDFEARNFHCLSEEEALQGAPAAVVLGFDTELTYKKIQTCYDLILRGIPYIATHADLLCPVTKDTFKPDVGSFISMFDTATGGKRPVVVGKPHKEAVEAISEKAGCPPHEIAFIGDRLYTDIRMAQNFDMTGVLVLSGETSREMLAQSPDRPKIVVESVADLIAWL
ncbi:MAG TPA: HAD-IIA family hydrolase [bacterium]|nr:HAD-IIA family hydrolase [bacterium]HPN42524.1 HAD-IIA family hydrolase [bacterium]